MTEGMSQSCTEVRALTAVCDSVSSTSSDPSNRVPAATANGEVVVNGMSPSRRNNRFANSGIVVELDIDKDFKKYEEFGALKGLEFQKDLEKISFFAGGRTQTAPAQRLVDFVANFRRG